MIWTMKDFAEKHRKDFPNGTMAKAIIYKLRFKNIYEPQTVKIIRSISNEEIDLGFRFGFIVEYNNEEIWVAPYDIEKIS